MGLKFTAVFENVACAALQDAFSIKAGASNPIRLLGIDIAQNGVGNVGDAKEADLRWQVRIGATTQGSGGTTPTPHNGQGKTTTTTVHANDTTQASAGTALTCWSSSFNVRSGLLFLPTPEIQQMLECPAGQIMQIAFPVAPNASTTFTGTVCWEELGT